MICVPDGHPRVLMWVGKHHYSPDEFTAEAALQGLSKRIAEIPSGLILGETWILLAHPDACYDPLTWAFYWLFGEGEVLRAPGIFHAFVPERAELILHEAEATVDRIAEERARGVEVVIVPNGAIDARISRGPGQERPKLALEDHIPVTAPVAQEGGE